MVIIKKTPVNKVSARLILDVLITEPKRRTVKYKGTASSYSMKTEFRDVVKKAKANALYKYLSDRGRTENIGSPEIMDIVETINKKPIKIQILDYRIKYFDQKFISIKRIRRRGKYYNMVRSKKTGEIIGFSKWKKVKPSEFKYGDQETGVESESY